MQQSKFTKASRVPPRPQSSKLYGHGTRDFTRQTLGLSTRQPPRLEPPNVKFTPGYTGFIPKMVDDEIHPYMSVPNKNLSHNLPGYSAFVP